MKSNLCYTSSNLCHQRSLPSNPKFTLHSHNFLFFHILIVHVHVLPNSFPNINHTPKSCSKYHTKIEFRNHAFSQSPHLHTDCPNFQFVSILFKFNFPKISKNFYSNSIVQLFAINILTKIAISNIHKIKIIFRI